MNKNEIEIIGDDHIATSTKTPLRENAFDQTDDEKIEKIQYHFTKIMETLGLT